MNVYTIILGHRSLAYEYVGALSDCDDVRLALSTLSVNLMKYCWHFEVSNVVHGAEFFLVS